MAERKIDRYVHWFYTPMALGFTNGLQVEATVYAYMDELSNFVSAPPESKQRGQELFTKADVVFTGEMSLYEAK